MASALQDAWQISFPILQKTTKTIIRALNSQTWPLGFTRSECLKSQGSLTKLFQRTAKTVNKSDIRFIGLSGIWMKVYTRWSICNTYTDIPSAESYCDHVFHIKVLIFTVTLWLTIVLIMLSCFTPDMYFESVTLPRWLRWGE